MEQETLNWLDGPGFVEWFDWAIGLSALTENQRRRTREWEKGESASVYTVDAWMISMGRHLSEVPDELYVGSPWRKPKNHPGVQV